MELINIRQNIKTILSKGYGTFICFLTTALFWSFKARAIDVEGCAGGTSSSDDFSSAYCTMTTSGVEKTDAATEAINFAEGVCPSSMSVLEEHLGTCWTCGLFNKIFDALNLLSTTVYEVLKGPSITLLAICLAFFLAFRIGKSFVTFTQQDPLDFWNQTGRVLFRTIFVTAILIQPVGVASYWLISPFVEFATDFNQLILKSYSGVATFNSTLKDIEPATKSSDFDEREERENKYVGVDLGQSSLTPDEVEKKRNEILAKDPTLWTDADQQFILGTKSSAGMPVSSETNKYALSLEALQTVKNIDNINNMMTCQIPESSEAQAGSEQKMLGTQVRGALDCMIRGLSKEASFGMAMGSSMMCNSWNAARPFPILPFPNLGMLLAGLMIWLVCFWLLISFAFKILDATVRLGILCTVLPLLLVAWVFPQTTEYAKKGFSMLVNIILNYIILAIVMAFGVILLLLAFQGDGSENLRQMFLDNNISGMSKAIDFPSWGFLFAGVCAFLAVQIIKLADKVASEYSNVEFGTSAGDTVGAMVSQVTGHAVKTATNTMKIGASVANEGRKNAGWTADNYVAAHKK